MLIREIAGLSNLGLGCSSFGGTHWGQQNDKDSISALMTAIDAGARHIDTAADYGSGRSETVIGNLIRRRPSIRDRLLIASKGGIKGNRKNFLHQIDNSRRRLGCDLIDIYYIHWPMSRVDPQPSLEALAEAREKQIIRYIGVSNFNPRELENAYDFVPIDACQFGYNLIWRNPEKELIPLCEKLGIARIAYAALAQGFLSGKYHPGSRFPDGDDREATAFFDKRYAHCMAEGLKKLKSVCKLYDTPLPNAALEWLAGRECIDNGLVGARNANQARDNFHRKKIDPELLEKIDTVGRGLSGCFGDVGTFW